MTKNDCVFMKNKVYCIYCGTLLASKKADVYCNLNDGGKHVCATCFEAYFKDKRYVTVFGDENLI
ncbi:MAG TPA: hypothetical protein VJ440_07720 [Candidatus Brocadiaceae bacterium]|nr:hypothetical protein [Candidatus Brocadiaceae bacterium]